MFSSVVPSMAEEPTCKAVVIGIGLGCSDKPAPSPTPSTEPTTEPTPVQPAPEKPLPQEPAVTPEPVKTTVVKEVVVAPPVVKPAPVAPTATPSPTTVLIIPRTSPSLTAEAIPPVNGEPASESSAAPDPLKQAGEAGPYIFFVSLAVLIAMIITAKVKKLFPFEDGAHRAEK
jgi:hypothetical protein